MRKGFITSIRCFYNSLMDGNIENLISLCTEDAILNWGPYKFEGREEIRTWATELRLLFPKLKIKEVRLFVRENNIAHKFILNVTTPDGRNGWIPCEGVYKFKNSSIDNIKINLSYGSLKIKSRNDFL